MKEFRPGDLVPDCDDEVCDDAYDDLIFQVVARASEGVSELLDALAEPLRLVDHVGPLSSA